MFMKTFVKSQDVGTSLLFLFCKKLENENKNNYWSVSKQVGEGTKYSWAIAWMWKNTLQGCPQEILYQKIMFSGDILTPQIKKLCFLSHHIIHSNNSPVTCSLYFIFAAEMLSIQHQNQRWILRFHMKLVMAHGVWLGMFESTLIENNVNKQPWFHGDGEQNG